MNEVTFGCEICSWGVESLGRAICQSLSVVCLS
jgi:hypothetical protein